MTDPQVSLTPGRIVAGPGEQTQVTVTIGNQGQIVEGYEIEVCGAGPREWSEAPSDEISVYPQQETSVVVVFSPPTGAIPPSGVYPFAVLVRSTVDRDALAVVEGDLEIRTVAGLHAKLIPVTSSGRWRGRHVVQLTNSGNASTKLRIVASDPDAALGFYLRPEVVELPPRGSATVRISVRTRKPFLRGPTVRLPFQVVGEPVGSPPPPTASGYGDPNRPVVDGALTQKPVLSSFLVTALIVLLIAGVALGVWLARTGPAAGDTTLTDVGVPATPDGVGAKAAGPTAITVAWGQVARITGYEIQPVEKDRPGAIGTVTAATTAQRAAQVKGLTPGTEYCFRVVSKREGVSSLPSKQVCERTTRPKATPTPTPSGPPPTAPSSGTPSRSTKPPTIPKPPLPPRPPDKSTNTAKPTASTPTPTDPDSASPPAALGRYARGAWVAGCAGSAYTGDPRIVQALEALFAADLPNPVAISKVEYPNLRHAFGPVQPVDYAIAAVGPYATAQQATEVAIGAGQITGKSCVAYQPEPW